MAINWDELRKKAKEGDKVDKKRKLSLSTREVNPTKAPKNPPPKAKGSKGKTTNKHKLDKGAKEYQKEQFRTKAVPQAILRANEKIINDVALGAVNLPYKVFKGKNLVDAGLHPTTKEAEKGAVVGNIAGNVVEYGMGYKAGGKLIEKGARKLLATKAGKNATAKLVGSKLGKKFGKETAEQVSKGIAKNIVGDATIGTSLNFADARGRGLEGKDLAKDMALNAALDFGVGNTLEFAPMAAKAVKNSKVGKAVDDLLHSHTEQRIVNGKVKNVRVRNTAEEVIDNAQKVGEKGNSRAKAGTPRKTKLPTKADIKEVVEEVSEDIPSKVRKTTSSKALSRAEFNKELDKEFDKAYSEAHDKLSDYIRDYKGKGSTVNIVPILEDNTGRGYRSTVSNNDPWYSKALKKYGSNASVNKNADKIADEILESDLWSARGQQEFANEYLYELGQLKQRNPIRMPERRPSTSNISAKLEPPIPQAKNIGNNSIGIINGDFKDIEEALDSATNFGKKAYKALVNAQSPIDELSKGSGDMRARNSVQATRTSRGTAEYIMRHNLVNPQGEVIDNRSFKEVFSPIVKNSEDFNTYAQNLNNISRWEQGKALDTNVSAEKSKKIVSEMLAKHPEFADITANINDFWQKFTHSWLVDTGRMTEEAWQAMVKKYPNYVPAFMKDKGVRVGGGRLSVNSGTKSAKAGTTLERVPVEDAMMEQMYQIINSTRKNDMFLSVIDTLRQNPDELKRFGIVKSGKENVGSIDIDDLLSGSEKDAIKEVNSKVYTISAMENGQKVTAYINKDMAEALGKVGDIIGKNGFQFTANIGKALTNPLKAGITGYNPIFAIANISRDIPTAIIQSEYGALKTTKNMFRGIYQMATNGEMWKRYQALGGKSAGYIGAHKGFEASLKMSKNPFKNIFEGLKTVLGSAGEATESIPRFAEFLSSMEKSGDVSKALTESAEVTVNFARAGEVTKFLDAWTLYLNAAVQGIDKFARTVKAHPLRTAARSIAVVGTPYALLTAYNWNNPHYQDLNDRTKQNYFCIPNLSGEVDEDGNAKTFIKIPINREYGAIFGSSIDVLAGYLSGETNPANGYKETIANNFMPPNFVTDNVLSPLFVNLPTNKDFAGRNIVPTNLENVSPELQYDYSTSGLARGIANVANNLGIPSDTLKSPMKVDYLIDSYGGYLGEVGQAVSDPQLQGLGERAKGAIIDPFTRRFTADPRFSSGVVSNFYDNKDAAEKAKNDEQILTGKKGQAYVENKVYTSTQEQLSDLSKQEREILSSDLPKDVKDKEIKAIREQKNEIARGVGKKLEEASANYKKNPTYEAEMTTQQKESYEKNYKGVMSKEEYAKAKGVLKESGYKKSIGQAYALMDSGKSSDIAKAFTSESAVKKAKWLKQAGITPEQLDSVAAKIDTDDSGTYRKEEIISYFNNHSGYSTAQKRAIFLALSTAKTSPY